MSINTHMAFNSTVVENQEIVEYGKFVRIDNNTLFPYISVFRVEQPDRTQMFYPNNTAFSPVTSLEMYPKYAVLTYNVNGIASQGNTQTSGNPSFPTQQVILANSTAGVLALSAVLVSGSVVSLPVAANSVATYNVSISGIIAYNGLTVTYLG